MRNGLTQCNHTQLNWAKIRNALKKDLCEARPETTSKASALYLQVAAKIICFYCAPDIGPAFNRYLNFPMIVHVGPFNLSTNL